MQAKLSVASVLALLSACGGGGGGGGGAGQDPVATPLPASVELVAPSTVELATATVLATNLPAATTGLQFAWDFGDGTQSSEARPSHAYSTPGAYIVQVAVRNAAGAQLTARASLQAGRFAALQDRHCTGADATGWCWQAPLPWGHRLNDVKFLDAANGWMVGDGGVMLQTHDGGLTWSERFMPGRDSLRSISFADAQRGWIAGSNPQLLWLTSDSGATWTAAASLPSDYPTPPDPRDAALPLPVLGPGTAFQGDTYAGWGADADGSAWALLASEDSTTAITTASLATRSAAGAAWKQATLPPAPIEQRFQVPEVRLSRTTGWAGYTGSTIFTATTWRTDNGGASWSQLAWPDGLRPDQITQQRFADGNTLWLQAYRDGRPVYLTADGGRTWLADIGQPQGTQDPISTLDRDGGGGLLMSYDDYSKPARQYRSLDNGKTWIALPGNRGLDQDITGLWFFDARHGMAVTSGLLLLDTEDGGRNWRRRDGVLPGGAADLQFVPEGTGWMLSAGRLLRSTDRGLNWSFQATLPEIDGKIARLQWLDANHGKATVLWRCVVTSKSSTCYWRLYATDDGGTHWRSVGDEFLGGDVVRFFSPLRGVRAGFAAAEFTADGGQTWRAAAADAEGFATGNVLRVSVSGVGWLLGRDKVWRSTDMGQTWRAVAQGSYSIWSGDSDSRFQTSGILRDVHFADALNGWMVGDGGVVMNTRDGGLTWAVQRTDLQNRLTQVFAFDAATVWIGGDYASILASATGGR